LSDAFSSHEPLFASLENALARTPTINHACAAFTENKRYPAKPRGIGDVVNRKAVSVYQTDAVLTLIWWRAMRRSGALPTKQ
jgi:hypothetical protein